MLYCDLEVGGFKIEVKVSKALEKLQKNQFITSEEFAEYSGIKLEIVTEYLQKVS